MAGIHPRRRRRKKKKALIASLNQSAVSALSEDPTNRVGRAATPLDTAKIVSRFKQLKQGGHLG